MLGVAVWVSILTEEGPLRAPLSCAGDEAARVRKIADTAMRVIIGSASFVRGKGSLLILTLMKAHFCGFENREGANRHTTPWALAVSNQTPTRLGGLFLAPA
jgi:hypothetical protein